MPEVRLSRRVGAGSTVPGACPRCPRLLFGPTPTDFDREPDQADPAGRGDEAQLAAPLSDRELIRDVLAGAFEQDGGSCEHNPDPDAQGACGDCLAEIALNALVDASRDVCDAVRLVDWGEDLPG